MNSPVQDDAESYLVSELIDLDGISLRTLRSLDNPIVNGALHFVAQQANRPSKTETSCSSLSGF